jgi:rhomboid protease GluP
MGNHGIHNEVLDATATLRYLRLMNTQESLPEDVRKLAQELVQEFHRTLAELTPRVFVTWVLIAANALVFIAMAATGVHLMEPTITDLLAWGANLGAQALAGEWWRLFTCTFVHVGVIHFLLNMWVLATVGPLVERMVGNTGFLVLYVLSGLCGSLASVVWDPVIVSAGASGAVFGVYGGLLAILLRQQGSVPISALVQIRNSALGFVGYNLFYGITRPNVDMAAHLGGLAGGFLIGLVLSQPFEVDAVRRRTTRNVTALALGALLLAGGTVGVSGLHADVPAAQAELERFVEVESKAQAAYNDAIQRARQGNLSDEGLADLLEREVLPDWRRSLASMDGYTRVPPSFAERLQKMRKYMRLRQEGWELLVQAVRENDMQKAQAASQKQAEADAAVMLLTDDAQ